MKEATRPTTDAAIDLHQAWFDVALQGHQLVQKQTDAWFDATRQLGSVQRETQSAFARLWLDAMLPRSKA